MKKMYSRLVQASLDALVIHRQGITGNTALCTGILKRRPFSNQQSNIRSGSKHKLAAAAMWFLFSICAFEKADAQSPAVNYEWLKFPSRFAKSVGSVIDKNNNFYTIMPLENFGSFNIPQITRRSSAGIVDTAWITFTGSNIRIVADLTVNDAATTLYYKCCNSAADSAFIGRITNIAGTPVNEPRWKFLRKFPLISPAGDGASLMVMEGSMVIDHNENLYLGWLNRIYKINDASADTNWCTAFPPSPINERAIRCMTVDSNNNIYLMRLITPNDGVNYMTKVNTTTAVADTLWSQLIANGSNEFKLGQTPRHLVITNNQIHFAYDSMITFGPTPATSLSKKMFKKVDLTTGTTTLINSFTSNKNYALGAASVADRDGNVYYAFRDSALIKLSNTGQLTAPYLKFNINPAYYSVGKNPQLLIDGDNAIYEYYRVPDPTPSFPPLEFGYFAKIIPPFNVTFNQTQPTCSNSTNGGLRAIGSGCSATPETYSYLWTPGNFTTDTISNLAPGTYNVRVICGTDTVNQSIVLTAITVVTEPATTNQSLCFGATVADLVATPSAGNSIQWYDMPTGGTPLANSTLLVNDAIYYASQITPSACESVTRGMNRVTIRATFNAINDTVFCSAGEPDIQITGGAPGNTYSWTSTQNGTGLPASGVSNPITFIINNTSNTIKTDTVYLSAQHTACTSGQSDTVIVTVLPAPKTDSIGNQLVCPGGTTAAINFTTPITGGGVGYKWTNNNTGIGLAAAGNGSIPPFTANAGSATITVIPYMLKSATDTCFGSARTFTITADLPPAPTTVGNLVVYTGTKTISQLDVTPLAGGTINFYYTATGGIALAGTTPVVDDTTYYITQTVAGCESNPRKQITVNRIADDSIVLCAPATVANLTTMPQTGNTASWFTTAVGGTALAGTTAIPAGQHTYYVEEGRSGTDTLVTIPGDFAVNFNTITALAHAENDTLFFGTYKGDIYKANPDGSDTVKIKPGTQQINWLVYKKEGANRFLYYTLYAGNDIKKFNLATGAVTTLGAGFFGVRQFHFDDDNNRIFIADAENYKVKMLNTLTNVVTAIDSFPGSFPTIPLRPFAIYYHAGFNKLYFSNFETNKLYSKDLSSFSNPKVEIATIPQGYSISLLPNGKFLIATGSGFIYTLNTDGTGLTALYSGLYNTVNPFYNSNNLLTYNTHTKVVREASILSNRVPVTIIVNPTPNVIATTDKVVCNNSATAAVNFSTTTTAGTVTYTWTNNKPGIGLAATGTGNIPSFTAVNTGTAPDTATVIVTPTIINAGVSCAGVKDTFLVIVNPTPMVNAITDKELCNGVVVPVLIPATTATGETMQYVWVNDNTSIGLLGGGMGNIPAFTATNNGSSPITAMINVLPILTNGGVSCSGPEDTFFITVNPTTKVNALADQVLCNGAGFSAVTPTTTATGGTTTYTWTNNNNSIGLAANGTGIIPAFTVVNNGTAPVTATVIVTPAFANGSAVCTGTPDTFSIIINPTAKLNAIGNKVECNGSAVAAITPTSTATGGTVTYSWTNDNTAIGLASNGTGTLPSFIATNTGNAAITANITVIPTFTANGLSCVGTSETFTITVNPPPVFNTNPDKTVCVGPTTPVNFITPLTGGTAVFTWTNSNTAIGLATGGNGTIPGFTATNTTTAPIAGEIAVYMEYTNAGLTCTSLTDTFNYIINPVPVINAVNSEVVCNNNATPAIHFSSPNTGGVVSYNWVNDNPGIGLDSIGNGSGSIASFTATNSSDTVAVATITVTPSFTNNGVSCSGTREQFTITVNPTAQVNNISSQAVCNNSNAAAVNFSTTRTGGTTSYAWTNSNPTIGLGASGNGNIAAFTAVNNTNAPVTATITVTPTFTNGGVSCSGPVKVFTITVNPTATVNAVSNMVVCNNSTTTETAFSSPAAGGTVQYNWTNSNTSIGLASSGSGNLPSFFATNTTTAPLAATITVTPVFTNGSISCTGTARQFTITVNPTAIVNSISNRVECNGSLVPPVIPGSTATGGTVTYTWTNSNTAIGLGAGGSGNVPGFTATNTTTAPVTATVTITPIYTNGGINCTGSPFNYTITVNPPPVFAATANQTACNGAAMPVIPFTTALTGGTATFAWTNTNTAIGLASGGSGNLPGFTAANNTNAPISAAISVVMTYTNAGLSCASLPQTFTYVVNPTAKVNPVSNQVLCNRAVTSPINFSSPTIGGTLVYNWVNNTPGIGLAGSGNGTIPAFTAVNNTDGPLTATITVTPAYTNAGISCTGTPVTFTITVNPTPVTHYTVNKATQCLEGNQFVFTNTTTGAIGYNWNLGDGSTTITADVVKSYTSPGTYTVKLVSANGFGCSDSISRLITVYPQPQKPVVIPEFGNGIHSSEVSDNYTWYNNNVALYNSNSRYYFPASAGYHQVQVTNTDGCSAKSDSLYYIPEKNFRSGLDGQYVFVYPLPVANGIIIIHFNLPLAHKVRCRLFNDIGQLLTIVEIPEGTRQYKLDVTRYPRANYVLRLDDENNLARGLVIPKIN